MPNQEQQKIEEIVRRVMTSHLGINGSKVKRVLSQLRSVRTQYSFEAFEPCYGELARTDEFTRQMIICRLYLLHP